MSASLFPSAAGAPLDAFTTASLLPWSGLAQELALVALDASVQVPPRIVMPLPRGGSLFCMPANDAQLAITKLITFTPDNVRSKRPTIQGDVTIFDIVTGQRQLIVDGPTVTARRTAAVSLLAAQRFAPCLSAPLLIIGAGVQGAAHLDAFAAEAGTREVWVASRSPSSAQALVQRAHASGLQAHVVTDMVEAVNHCPNIITCTSAQQVVLHQLPRPDAFIAAVGAFTPQMAEIAPAVCHHIAQVGHILVDTAEAIHEAGDLLQAGMDVSAFATLAQSIRQSAKRRSGPVLFKSCGWGGWDLAAARLASRCHLRQVNVGAEIQED